MAESIITSPDGTRYKVTHPDDATYDEIIRNAQEHHMSLQDITPKQPLGEAFKGAGIEAVRSVPVAGALAERAMPQSVKDIGERFSRDYPGSALTSRMAGGAAAAGLAAAAPEAVAPLLGVSRTMGPLGNAAFGAFGGGGIGASDAAIRGQNPVVGGTIGAIGGATAPVIGAATGAGVRNAADLTRAVPGPLNNLGMRARGMLGEALTDATPHSLANARRTMGPQTFAGETTQGMFDLTRGIAGGADQAATDIRNAYTSRLAGGRGRMENEINTQLGQRANVPQTLEQILDARSQQARPLYQRAYSQPVPPDPDLRRIMQNPDVQTGLARGVANAQREAAATGQPFNASGWQLLDAARRGLHEMAETAVNPVTGRPTDTGRTYGMLRDSLARRMDQLNPDYAAARAAWAGPTRVQQAMRDGGEALQRGFSADELLQEHAGRNAAERAAFAIGMRNDIANRMDMARNGDVNSRTLLMSPAARNKIAAVFGQNPSDHVAGFLEQEHNIGQRTTAVVPNQATGASNVSREEARSLANPPSALHEYVSNIDLTRPQTLLGGNMDPRVHMGSMLENSNERARSQLAPVLTAPVGNDLLNALLAARARHEGNAAIGANVGRGVTLSGMPITQEMRRRFNSSGAQ